jgi:antitoxin component YwqK of YwqJK toxin-antitoxin module
VKERKEKPMQLNSMEINETYHTKYGVLQGIENNSTYHSGALKECVVSKKVELATDYGVLIPQYDFSDPRKKNQYAISFYEDGSLRGISLNKATDLMTPIGPMGAERILFYPNGKLKRLFPLNGQLSAYWDEDDEYQLAREEEFEFSFGKVKAKIIAISFYEDGNIKNLTFWPKSLIFIETPVGKILTRIGISLYSNGNIKSLEPAAPVKILTPIGSITAYDDTANGITGDINSLNFTEDGKLKSLVTSDNKITVGNSSGRITTYSPEQMNDEDGIEITFLPLIIEFEENTVCFNHGVKHELSANTFTIENYVKSGISECSDCSSCNHDCKVNV